MKIYICPKCFNFRLVSRKPDAICFHCGMKLEQSSLDYGTYMNMTENERDEFRESYKKRIMEYHKKLNSLYNNLN